MTTMTWAGVAMGGMRMGHDSWGACRHEHGHGETCMVITTFYEPNPPFFPFICICISPIWEKKMQLMHGAILYGAMLKILRHKNEEWDIIDTLPITFKELSLISFIYLYISQHHIFERPQKNYSSMVEFSNGCHAWRLKGRMCLSLRSNRSRFTPYTTHTVQQIGQKESHITNVVVDLM